jgi:hypothetical protein
VPLEKQAPSEGQTEKAEGAAEKSTEKPEDSEKTASPPKVEPVRTLGLDVRELMAFVLAACLLVTVVKSSSLFQG